METKTNKNFSPHSSCATWQELQLKQIFRFENIEVKSQKTFSLPDRYYIADFFLPNNTILECSFTSMKKYQVALRNKAIQLEAKSFQLKKFYPSLIIWVLLESQYEILEPMMKTINRLIPSVDKVFFSQMEFLEYLRRKFSSSIKFRESN